MIEISEHYHELYYLISLQDLKKTIQMRLVQLWFYSHGDRPWSRVVYFPVCLHVVPVINSTALHPKREGEEGSLKQKHWTGDNER